MGFVFEAFPNLLPAHLRTDDSLQYFSLGQACRDSWIINAAALKSRSVTVQEQSTRLVNIEFLRDHRHQLITFTIIGSYQDSYGGRIISVTDYRHCIETRDRHPEGSKPASTPPYILIADQYYLQITVPISAIYYPHSLRVYIEPLELHSQSSRSCIPHTAKANNQRYLQLAISGLNTLNSPPLAGRMADPHRPQGCKPLEDSGWEYSFVTYTKAHYQCL